MDSQTFTFCSQISAMNNMAVAHLIDERPDECLELLQCALNNVRTALQHYADLYQVATAKKRRHRRIGSLFQSVPLSVHSATKSSTNEGGTFAFFDRLLTLSQDAFLASNSKLGHHSQEESAVETLLLHQNHLLVTLFFNMAICHHAKGIRQCQSSDLSTALQLYELAFSIMDTTTSSDFGWGDQQMILLAIYNNMGHIHASFCNTPETQLCVEFVKQIFLANPATSSQPTTKEDGCLLEPYDYQFFAQYIPVDPCKQCNIASAA